MTEAEQQDTFAVVLIKCHPGDEQTIRTAITHAHTTKTPLCLRNGEGAHTHGKVTVRETAYCFGPFDFVLVVQSSDVRHVERFVVECIRVGGVVVDTQTILGIVL